jgi:hypothetical protein
MYAPEFDDYIVHGDLYSPSNSNSHVYGVNWFAQTFTATQSYPLAGIQFKCYTVGTPGDVVVSLKAVAASLPDGADLASITVSSADYVTWTSGSWEVATFSSDYNITAGTSYAIVVKATAGDAANYLAWMNHDAGTYTGGTACVSGDSGGTWAVITGTVDFTFACNGFQAHSMGYLDQMRNRLIGTPFDFTALANMVGISRMWINTLIWLIVSFALGYFVCKGAISFKPMMLSIFFMIAPGAYLGFLEPLLAMVFGFLLGVAAIYVTFYYQSG